MFQKTPFSHYFNRRQTSETSSIARNVRNYGCMWGWGAPFHPPPHSNPCIKSAAARKTREPAGEVYREAPCRPKSSPGPPILYSRVPLQRSAESPGHHSFPDTPGMSGSDKRVRDIFQIIFSLRCASLRAGPTSLPETTRGQWSSLHHHLGKGKKRTVFLDVLALPLATPASFGNPSPGMEGGLGKKGGRSSCHALTFTNFLNFMSVYKPESGDQNSKYQERNRGGTTASVTNHVAATSGYR
ncbi:hypothetical protein CDAR_18291 [Caerostris darwini]|uniref:Uncharacterized protein n=1 Tax=Caerostris darwini TaxID=1538125 RepID=A0AAV4V9V0_9ARAC|nr:hypothetical protein CDAR_18291 [Caerostris darwini]